LTKKKVEDDGFGHMVEEDIEDKEAEVQIEEIPSKLDQQESKEPVLQVNPADFDYDETCNIIKPKYTVAFDTLIENHPSVHKSKEGINVTRKLLVLRPKFWIL
jgi:hypothetical protein